MTRAYIRLDPAFDERKESYPDGPYAALVATLCLAEAQPVRGRFRSADYLKRLLGKRGRHVAYLLDKGDLTTLPDGRLYVDGWDEWQEGDWKVGERVARIRNRPRNGQRNGAGNAPRNAGGNSGTVQGGRLDLLDSAGADKGADKALALTTDATPVERDRSIDQRRREPLATVNPELAKWAKH